jgi:hypothetical protein
MPNKKIQKYKQISHVVEAIQFNGTEESGHEIYDAFHSEEHSFGIVHYYNGLSKKWEGILLDTIWINAGDWVIRYEDGQLDIIEDIEFDSDFELFKEE